MARAEEHRVETTDINGINVTVTSYRIEDRFYCHIANVDPGATIARAEGGTRQEALQRALAKATERLTSSVATRG
jgi:hypothetical protein